MKKILKLSLLILFLSFVCCKSSQAINFEEAYNNADRTPMIVLVYADWAEEYQRALQSFRSIQSDFVGDYNFVELDIAKPEAKFFNTKYHIYPNAPYALLFKDGGRSSRYIPRDCVLDSACITNKLKLFLQ
ncbi:MAG: hypothetical protein E7Z92_05810 [Cyanobacteria bacterium SIG31]|nr:hypothetical protein [Cyanobacteria bacterium SIG31]